MDDRLVHDPDLIMHTLEIVEEARRFSFQWKQV